MKTDDFLDLLEQRGILPPDDVESLREQAAESPTPVHPVFVARRLVQTGYLNAYFAKTLLSELADMSHQDEHATATDEPELEPLPLDKPQDDVNRPAATVAQETAAEPMPHFDDLGLPTIESLDLANPASADNAPLLPSARPKSGLAALFGAGKPLRLGRRHVNYETYLLGACAILAVLAIALVFYVVVNA
jgi:hypothetical protein